MPDSDFITAHDAQPPFFIGVDLGGTSIKIGVVDDLGRPLHRFSIDTATEHGPEDGSRRMGEAVLRAIDETGIRRGDVGGVGLGSPGTMDIPAGMLIRPHNLPGWFNFPIRDRVSHHCGMPVTFANDANAAAFGEYWVGRGREFHSMVLLTLGTGIGGGIIIGDRVIEGENSHGAELGHTIIDFTESARMCPCGQLGHLEGYAAALAVIKRMHEALDAGRESTLAARRDAGDELTPLLLAEQAEAGDALSLELILETAGYLGIAIVNFLHAIDPNGVVLGGAMNFGGNETELGRRFLDRVREEVTRRAFPVIAERITIDFATLEGDAGFIGAAGLARLASRQAKTGE